MCNNSSASESLSRVPSLPDCVKVMDNFFFCVGGAVGAPKLTYGASLD